MGGWRRGGRGVGTGSAAGLLPVCTHLTHVRTPCTCSATCLQARWFWGVGQHEGAGWHGRVQVSSRGF